jgi:tetratricopeptide (TPR) repeat protein
MKTFGTLLLFLTLAGSMAVSALASPSPMDLLSTGRVDDAVRTLNTRVQTNPSDAEAYHLLSRAYFHLRKWDDAINYGEMAIQRNPNKSDYYMWLGRAYGEKADESSFITAAGLAKKIRSDFEKAVELDPNNVAARSDLSEYYIEAPGFMGGGTDKAEAQARALMPIDAAKAHWVLGRIAEKKKDSATAEREYKQSIEVAPDAEYWLSLASFYRRQDRLVDMEAAVNQAMTTTMKKSNSLYDAASLLNRAGRNLPAAVGYLRRYLSLPTINEEAPAFEAHNLLGAILQKQGDKAGAANEYRTSLTLAADYKPSREALKKLNE